MRNEERTENLTRYYIKYYWCHYQINADYIAHILYDQADHEKRIFETVKINDTNEKNPDKNSE